MVHLAVGLLVAALLGLLWWYAGARLRNARRPVMRERQPNEPLGTRIYEHAEQIRARQARQ
jgi:glucose-6-phosphate-specific signal transduction histidine kinase